MRYQKKIFFMMSVSFCLLAKKDDSIQMQHFDLNNHYDRNISSQFIQEKQLQSPAISKAAMPISYTEYDYAPTQKPANIIPHELSHIEQQGHNFLPGEEEKIIPVRHVTTSKSELMRSGQMNNLSNYSEFRPRKRTSIENEEERLSKWIKRAH